MEELHFFQRINKTDMAEFDAKGHRAALGQSKLDQVTSALGAFGSQGKTDQGRGLPSSKFLHQI